MRAPAAFDSVVLAAVIRDLHPHVGARIRAVLQPSAAEIALELRRSGLDRILISVHARWARIHLSPPLPSGEPGPFAQMLRARLTGARLDAVLQPPFERAVTLRFETDAGPCDLVAELMGRHSNLILVQDGLITGALKLVSGTQSSVREVLPGRIYSPAPRDRQPPAAWAPPALAALLAGSETAVAQTLTTAILGLGPVMARELCVRAGVDPGTPAARISDTRALHDALLDLDRLVREEAFAPVLYLSDGRPAGFAPFPLRHVSALAPVPVPTMSEAVAAVTGHLSTAAEFDDQRRSLVASIHAALRKADHAASELARALEEADGAGRLRVWGELLLAYASQIPAGSAEAVLPGYEGEMVTVSLDRTLTPVENARRLFERYARMRDARPAIDARLSAVRDDQRYLAAALAMAETASSADDLAELRRELADEGYLPRRRVRPARAGRPRTLALPDGAHLLVGRSNRDNDHVTFKVAGPEELWFHARGVPGAHVILRTGGRAPTEPEIAAAASAAAYFSAARGAGRVAVDYTARKHVRKPKDSKPGMAIYERETTVQVIPGIPR